MISHVLVHRSSGYVDGLVIRYFLEHFGEALQGILKLAQSMVHQTQVKSTAYEFVVEFQSLLIHFDSFLIVFLIVLVSLLKDVLRLALISQSFRVP